MSKRHTDGLDRLDFQNENSSGLYEVLTNRKGPYERITPIAALKLS